MSVRKVSFSDMDRGADERAVTINTVNSRQFGPSTEVPCLLNL